MFELMDIWIVIAARSGGAPVKLVLGIVIAIVNITILMSLLKRFKRCPKGKALVITGQTQSGKPETHVGGAQFIWPLLQDYAYLDLSPITVTLGSIQARTLDKVTVTLEGTATVAVSQQPEVLGNAAIRLLGLEPDAIAGHAGNVLTARLTEVVSGKTIDGVDGDRVTFLIDANSSITSGLNELGLELVSLAITDLRRATPPPTP